MDWKISDSAPLYALILLAAILAAGAIALYGLIRIVGILL